MFNTRKHLSRRTLLKGAGAVDRLALVGCHDPRQYGNGANRRQACSAAGLRLLCPWRPSGRVAAQADRPGFRASVYLQAARALP